MITVLKGPDEVLRLTGERPAAAVRAVPKAALREGLAGLALHAEPAGLAQHGRAAEPGLPLQNSLI